MTPEEKEVVWRVLRDGYLLKLATKASELRSNLKQMSRWSERDEGAMILWHRDLTETESQLNSLLDSL